MVDGQQIYDIYLEIGQEVISMGTVISITSGKGGTGKTSITGGVAAALALMDHRVLCIDMDIGLRNLDITLGLNDRALMDFSDVALGRCPLARAAVEHPDLKGLALLTAPMSLPASLTADKVRALLSTARTVYDYILKIGRASCRERV